LNKAENKKKYEWLTKRKPYKMTEEKIQNILKHLEDGLTLKDSCDLENVSDESFRKWKKENVNSEILIKQAELRRKSEKLKIIHEAATTDWRAAAWYLERKYPKEFALKGRTEDPNKEALEKLDKILSEMKAQVET